MIYVVFALMGLIVYLQHTHEAHLTLARDIARCGSPDLREMVELVDRLAQRVQAPDVAVAQHVAAGVEYTPPAVSMFDDDEYHLAKEELAERLAIQEAERAVAV